MQIHREANDWPWAAEHEYESETKREVRAHQLVLSLMSPTTKDEQQQQPLSLRMQKTNFDKIQ